jgi:iron(III) transport system substrate-binding protein
MRKNWMKGLLAAVAGLVLSAPAWADAQSDFDALVTAAKKEGTLHFYNAQTGFPEPTLMMQAFEAKYGIKVNKLEARGAELMERIRVEGTNNKVGGDVLLMGSTGVVPIARMGLLADHGPLPNMSKLQLQPWTPEEVPVYEIA